MRWREGERKGGEGEKKKKKKDKNFRLSHYPNKNFTKKTK